MQKTKIIFLPNENATTNFAKNLAVNCLPPFIIYLYGAVGSGKTTFCRSFLTAYGYIGLVKSPTYSLVESYFLPTCTIYHFDLYRLCDPEELEFIGVRDYLNKNSICLIEWPNNGIPILTKADIKITLDYLNNERIAQIRSYSINGTYILTKLHEKYKINS